MIFQDLYAIFQIFLKDLWYFFIVINELKIFNPLVSDVH